MTQLINIGSLSSDEINYIYMYSAQVSDDNFDSISYPLGTNFQVPLNNQLIITKITMAGDIAKSEVQIGYGDNGVTDSPTEPLNPVYLVPLIPLAEANTLYEEGVVIRIPATKYPFVSSQSGHAHLMLFGILTSM